MLRLIKPLPVSTIVKCPTCRRPVDWSPESPYRPFCSDRCRLIDLGAWLTEQHKIPDDTEHEGEELQSDRALSDRAEEP